MATEKQIISEIADKVNEFEGNQAAYLAEVGQWSDLFKVKPPPRAERTFSNPRQTEFFRAATAVGTLMYRMQTSADPFFNVMPADLNADYDKLDTISHVLRTQLNVAKYRQALLRACHFAPVFGTVICQEDYREIGVSVFGRRIPATVLIPRVLDQIAFDRACSTFDDANWVTTADIVSSSDLMRLAQESKDLDGPWNEKALEHAASMKEDKNTINWRVLQRLSRSGVTEDFAFSKKKELVMYYGKLDCMNDGIEYVAALINRKVMVRFHANRYQHGRRNFRVAKWVDFDSAMGYGFGSLFANHHRAMDANRQKAQDLASFNAYGMTLRRKNSVADEDLVIKPLQVIDVDDINNDLRPYTMGAAGQDGILRLDEFLKQEFRAATHASDTLQAIVTDATATASSLAQNEAMRAVSVKAEMMAIPLGKEHLENMHYNNVQNIRAPFNINKAGIVKRVYPADLRCDIDIEFKTTTDKDFQPKQLEKLINVLQILTSTKSQHPDQMNISVLPIVRKIAYLLDVNPKDVITAPTGMPALAPGMLSGLAGATAPNFGGGAAGGMGPMETPAGPTLVA